MNEAPVIVFDGVYKTYRDGTVANDNVTFSVQPGEVFGLLGPNGAGKTTLVNQLFGLARPTRGAVRVAGVDVVRHPDEARRRCSVQPQAAVPMEGLTPREFIQFVARLRGASRRAARKRGEALLSALDITAWADRPSETLSGGVLRLAAFCAAAAAPAAAVVLDEPTNDVDPIRRRLLWDQVGSLAQQGRAVLLVTHNVLEAERAVDRVGILDRGVIVACGTPGELKRRLAHPLRLSVRYARTQPPCPPFAVPVTAAPTHATFAVPGTHAAEATAWATALADDAQIEEFSLAAATLEDAYADHLQPEEQDALRLP